MLEGAPPFGFPAAQIPLRGTMNRVFAGLRSEFSSRLVMQELNALAEGPLSMSNVARGPRV